MSYKVIVDSCGELTEDMKKSGLFETASLSMEVGGVRIIDDETFDQADFLRRVAASPECPKSSCPSPEEYMERYHCEADRVYNSGAAATLTPIPTAHRLPQIFSSNMPESFFPPKKTSFGHFIRTSLCGAISFTVSARLKPMRQT